MNQLPKSSLMVAGFLILAICSTMITFKQARAVDALGDVAALQSEIRELEIEASESDDDDKNKEEIKELREELPEQQHQAQAALAAVPNGAVIWSLLSQLGAALFGLSIISIFQRSDENERVRSIALIVIGGMVLTFIAARFAYLMIGGASAGAGSL
ncbi:MAG: hypothetical protein ACON5N_04790 [Akkermansiaceae bacterium]